MSTIPDHAGIRWYELRRAPGGTWSIRQQGTYAPDGNSRWMGSIMLNGENEIGLGYSVSSNTMYPGSVIADNRLLPTQQLMVTLMSPNKYSDRGRMSNGVLPLG